QHVVKPGAKLGLTASNSLQFAHWRGPFASPRWAPQKAHEGRSKELCKGLGLLMLEDDSCGIVAERYNRPIG
ncbi:MAG: hypothetical protein NWE77_09080, partial [Candidatus Bathyarchaeota archaeon]|nr:hypothetical protein [Candidatus Bathyarchaeota archaeon]